MTQVTRVTRSNQRANHDPIVLGQREQLGAVFVTHCPNRQEYAVD